LDDNLDVIDSVSKPGENYNITDIANGLGISPIYAANGVAVAGNLAYENYSLTKNVYFYLSSDVQEITDQADLNAVRDNLGGKYILLNDIELNATDGAAGFDAEGWQPIGDFDNSFTGIFNGNNHKITNIWADRATRFVGFFGAIKNAQIKNLGIEIEEGKEIKSNNEYVGGITGYMRDSAIANSYSIGDISGTYNVGGIAGDVYYSNITSSYSSGNIYGNNNFVGGIAGYIDDSSITNNAAINLFVTGNPSENFVNRIVGQITSGTATNNFALDEMEVKGAVYGGAEDDSNGISKTINDFKDKSTYETDLGWDFGNDDTHPWEINPDKNNGLPYFYWQNL
jgi:hypothetical protein